MIRLDELVNMPALPGDIDEVNTTAQTVFTVGQIVPMAIFFWLAHRYRRQHRTWIPWAILAGGFAMSIIEPFVDHNGLVWFPTEGQATAFRDYGVSLPLWLVIAYIWFFGGRVLYLWHALEIGKGADRTWWFKSWGVVFGIDIVLETVGLYMGLFFYYGEQPFKLGKFPLWWAAINSTTPLVLAVLIFVLRSQLRGWRMLAIVPMSAATCAAVNAAAGWPVYGALHNTQCPTSLVWCAGALTFALAIGIVHLTRALAEVCARAGLVDLAGGAPPTERAPERGTQFA